jgi:integrase
VQRVGRVRGPDIWVFRAREIDEDGVTRRPAIPIGDVEEFPTKSEALTKVEELGLRKQFNASRVVVTMGELVFKFKRESYPSRSGTCSTYNGYLAYVEDRWECTRLSEMVRAPKVIDVWLNDIDSRLTGEPLSRTTRERIKTLMYSMFEAAMGWGFIPKERNPMDWVKVRKGKRAKERLAKLTPEQFQRLIEDMLCPKHVRVMATAATLTGFRISEILGLRWEDSIDFENHKIKALRSVVGPDEEETKTPDSYDEVPMSEYLEKVLLDWKEEEPVINGWVFGSIRTGRPFDAGGLQHDHLRLALRRIGIMDPDTGWHTLRHTYRSFLADLDAPLEVQKTLMRHTNIGQTLKYGKHSRKEQDKRRTAQESVTRMATGTDGH